MIMLDSFNALLQAAHEQQEKQRFLLVFVKTVLPEDADAAQLQRFQAGAGGGLVPVMYADKAADELVDFDALVAESEEVGKAWGKHMTDAWDKVIVGCLSGRNGRSPTPEDAEEPLKHIVRMVQAGGSLGNLIAFDRDGDPVRFE